MKSNEIVLLGGVGVILFLAYKQSQQANNVAVPRYVPAPQPQIIYQPAPAVQQPTKGSTWNNILAAGTVATGLISAGSTFWTTIKGGQNSNITPLITPPIYPGGYA